MNTSAIPESAVASVELAPAAIPATRLLYWSVRRELWENRSIYVAPLAVAAVFLFGFMISTFRLAEKMRTALALSPAQQQKLIEQPYVFAELLLMATTFIVTVLYCLDALQGERRDRSVWFWKSLPVSDLMTVLSKASIPLVVIPLLTFAITVVTQSIILVLSSLVLAAGSGPSVATLWNHLSLFPMWVMLFCHLLFIHGLWYAPIYGWLLLVSGWSRRVAFLWAGLPLLAIGIVEKIAFNSSHFAAFLGYRFGGGTQGNPFTGANMSMDPMKPFNLVEFVTSPGLWTGLIMAALLLAAAVRLRRRRQPN